MEKKRCHEDYEIPVIKELYSITIMNAFQWLRLLYGDVVKALVCIMFNPKLWSVFCFTYTKDYRRRCRGFIVILGYFIIITVLGVFYNSSYALYLCHTIIYMFNINIHVTR